MVIIHSLTNHHILLLAYLRAYLYRMQIERILLGSLSEQAKCPYSKKLHSAQPTVYGLVEDIQSIDVEDKLLLHSPPGHTARSHKSSVARAVEGLCQLSGDGD